MHDLDQALNERHSTHLFCLTGRCPGMFLQTFLLALTARPRHLCAVSIAGYPYPDFPANHLHIQRNPIDQNVVFHDY
jgi:hypothetical protein